MGLDVPAKKRSSDSPFQQNPKVLLALVVLAIAIGIGASVALSGKDPLRVVALFPWWVWPVTLGMIVLGWNVNALRYRMLLKSQGVATRHRDNVGVVMATEFGYVATPFGSGGPATFIWLNVRRGISPAVAGGVFALDQMLDLVFFLSALPLVTIGLIGLPGRFHWGAEIVLMAVLLGAALLGAGLALRHHRVALRGGSMLFDRLRVRGRWRHRLTRFVLRLRLAIVEGLRMSRGRLLALYGLCALHWLLRYGVLFVLVAALGLSASFSYAFFVQLVTMGLGQVSSLPGGAGAVEVSFSVLLAPMVPTAMVGVLLLAWRFVTFYWYLIAGGAVFALHMLGARRKARGVA